jgi:Bax protein
MIKRCLFVILFLLCTISTAQAEIKTREFNGVIYVEETTVSELEDLFEKHNYRRFLALKNREFPAILIKKMPTDFLEIKSQKYRNELFIRMLTPLAIKVNEELYNERQSLLRLERRFQKDQSLSEDDTKKLEELSMKYDYFTRRKGVDRIRLQLEQLKLRINTIPPSLMVAIAAMESDWGFSRIANEANSLYKEKVWFTDEGLEPLENKDDGYRFKIFDSLIDSMRSYAHTFNSNINYQYVWQTRADAEKRLPYMVGESMAYTLSLASNLPNYVGILDYTTAFYDFMHLDNGKLKRIKK